MNAKMPVADSNLKETKLDPLCRIFVPIERPTDSNTFIFRTTDKETYERLEDGSIHRINRKVRGKAARRADKVMRERNKHKKPAGSGEGDVR